MATDQTIIISWRQVEQVRLPFRDQARQAGSACSGIMVQAGS
jgi:hypothetical protein